MLKALYDYGMAHPDIIEPFGCSSRMVHWVICLGKTGEFLGILQRKEKVVCPDVGGKACVNGNVLMEKANVALCFENATEKQTAKIEHKRMCFLNWFLESDIPECLLVADLLSDGTKMKDVCDEALSQGVKSNDVVGFSVDGILLSDLGSVRAWWAGICSVNDGEPTDIDVVTGELCVPALTYKMLSMKAAGGGQSAGVALVSHNVDAFYSYGRKQNLNCPMSVQTANIIMDSLSSLSLSAPRVADMKFTHWYESSIPKDDDIFISMFGKASDEDKDEAAAKNSADEMVTSILAGRVPQSLEYIKYHILITYPEAARLVIRHYGIGSYGELYQNLKQWYEGLQMETADGRGYEPYIKLNRMIYALLSNAEQSAGSDKFKPVRRLAVSILQACLSGGHVPDGVVSRVLLNIRSSILSDGHARIVLYQWLKLWISQKEQEKGDVFIMPGLNDSHPEPAYHCGRMLAVYSDLQNTISPMMNSTVIDRYYSACSQSPAMTLGMLQKLSVHHFSKLTSGRLRKIYMEALASAYDAAGDVIPKSMSMEQQAYFALGYQQQLSALAKAKQVKKEMEEIENGNLEEQI